MESKLWGAGSGGYAIESKGPSYCSGHTPFQSRIHLTYSLHSGSEYLPLLAVGGSGLKS